MKMNLGKYVCPGWERRKGKQHIFGVVLQNAVFYCVLTRSYITHSLYLTEGEGGLCEDVDLVIPRTCVPNLKHLGK